MNLPIEPDPVPALFEGSDYCTGVCRVIMVVAQENFGQVQPLAAA
jgi:hypothetical protein